jgi:predicted glycoside hydrolase/deacetylase ChbG (UPF0249 family)
VRKIIFNADDGGLTEGVNRAIFEAHSGGVLRSATLMANGGAFAEAAALAKDLPGLSAGCHLVFVDGTPVCPPGEVRSLLGKDGARFHTSLASFAARAMAGLFRPEEIEKEAIAQIRKLQSAGITVSHVDTHKHTHLFPPVLRPVLRAARACGVPAIRNPFEPLRLSAFGGKPRMWKRYAQLLALSRLRNNFLKSVKESGLATPDGTWAVAATGSLERTLFRKILKSLPDGTWEFVCHPGYNDQALLETGTRLRESREKELVLLTSHETLELLRDEKIGVISYRDLAAPSGK